MTIHLAATPDADRTAFLCVQDPCTHPDPDDVSAVERARALADCQVLGWIEQGRAMTNLRSNWTEWRFTAADPNAVEYDVRRSFSKAYDDARACAAGLYLD